MVGKVNHHVLIGLRSRLGALITLRLSHTSKGGNLLMLVRFNLQTWFNLYVIRTIDSRTPLERKV